MYLHKPSYTSLRLSAETCQLCRLFLRDLNLSYGSAATESAEEEGLPTPIQVAASSATFEIDELDSMNDTARLATLWVLCGELLTVEETVAAWAFASR